MAGYTAVICGAGVAGVEGLLRLRRLAGDRVDVVLLSPATELVYRPLAVLEPFRPGAVRRYPVERIAADAGARWVRGSLGWVDRQERVVHADDGTALGYDALLLAPGGRSLPPFEPALVFAGPAAPAEFARLLDGIEDASVGSLAFVLPDGPCWPLPLYELALLTAHRAAGHGTRIALVTPEPAPLHAFGADVGAAVRALLERSGVQLHAGCHAGLTAPGRLALSPGGELAVDRVVTVPLISGPNVRGMPGSAADRFLEVDEFCRVRGTDGSVFAAGDATDLPVKHGGVGAQQADTAAAGIAHRAGAAGPPAPLRPVIRATLLTGAAPLYLAAHLIAGRGWRGELFDRPPWPAGEKVVAAELAPYLERLDAAAAADDRTARGPSG